MRPLAAVFTLLLSVSVYAGKFCENLLVGGVLIPVGREMPYSVETVEGSEFSKLPITILWGSTNSKFLYVPGVETINSVYGLEEGKSRIIFKLYERAPVDPEARNPVPTEVYNEHLARGVVLISKYVGYWDDIFLHDVVDHVPGYKIISETETWSRTLKLLREMTEVLKSESLSVAQRLMIHKQRDSYCDDLDDLSANVSLFDRSGLKTKIENALRKYDEGTSNLELWWEQIQTGLGD